MRKTTGSDVIIFSCLLLMSAILPLVTPCHLNISNLDDAREMFKEYTEVQKAKVVNIRTSGLNWSDSSNESMEVFDPNWWSWATEDTTTLLEMPLDYNILSLGLLSLAIKDMNIHFVSGPSGCFGRLDFLRQRQMVMAEIMRLTDGPKHETGDDMLCRSVYSQRSLATDNMAGVGKTCCTKKELRRNAGRDCDGKRAAQETKAYTKKAAAVSVIGTLLPFMIIPCALAWWQLHPISAGKDFARYLMNKLTKYAHFSLRGRATLDQNILIIKERDLEPYGGSISLLELLNIDMKVSPAKIKLTIVLLLQYVPIVGWLIIYSFMAETLHKLDTCEKIVLNLRNNPLSWLFTDKSCWPYYVAMTLLVVNFFQIVFVIIWWLLEKETVRLWFASLFRRMIRKWAMWTGKAIKEDDYMYRVVEKTFTGFFIYLLCCSYVSVYALSHSIMYTIGGLIVSIDLVSPWLTGGLLVVYYIQRSYGELVDTYTEIKRLVFDICKTNKVYKATHIVTKDVVDEDLENQTIKEQDEKIVYFRKKKCEGAVLFVYKKENNIVNIMISKEMLREICKRIQPIDEGVKFAVVKLFFTILFLFLVVFTTTVFRINTATGEISALITSMATLLTALIPRLADMVTTDAESRLSSDVKKFKIEKDLCIHRPWIKMVDTVKTPRETIHVNPIRRTQTISVDSPDTDSEQFDGKHDELPTITNGSPIDLEELETLIRTAIQRQRHESAGSRRSTKVTWGSGLPEECEGRDQSRYAVDGRPRENVRAQMHVPQTASNPDHPANATELELFRKEEAGDFPDGEHEMTV